MSLSHGLALAPRNPPRWGREQGDQHPAWALVHLPSPRDFSELLGIGPSICSSCTVFQEDQCSSCGVRLNYWVRMHAWECLCRHVCVGMQA